MRDPDLYKMLIALFLLMAFAGASHALEQNSHLRFLQAQKAYIEAVNRRADPLEIRRLAQELEKARGSSQPDGSAPASLNSEPASLVAAPQTGASVSASVNEESGSSDKKSPFRFFTKLRDKISFAVNQLRELFPKLSRLQAFFVQKRLKEKHSQELGKIANQRRNFGWHPADDISGVVNAHYTNTFSELKKALESDCNWFECDVRLEGPLRSVIPIFGGERRAVTAHDPFQTNGLLFDDWVRIVAASNRGIKVDLKTDNALTDALATLKKHGIKDRKLIMNINVAIDGPEGKNDGRLKMIRNDFPDCYIKLSPGGGSSKNGKYTDDAVDRLIDCAHAAGEPVLFALRAEWVTPEIVSKLEKHGKVSIWNTTWSFNPKNVQAEVEKFRAWGVSGIIDLMSTLDSSVDH